MKTRKKIDILDKAPFVSKKEMESYMDFDKVLNASTSAVSVGNQFLKGTLIAVGILLAGIVYYHFIFNDETSSKTTIVLVEQEQLKKDESVTENIAIIKKDKAEKIIPKKNEFISKPIIPSEKKEEVKQVTKEESFEGESMETTQEESPTEEPSYSYIEAVPVEGLSYLYAYFRENLTYPDELRKDSIRGVVLISFSITKDSTISNVVIVQSLGEKFDNEAIRVITNMPQWIPASVNNTPVSSKLSIPLTFNIEK